MKNHKQYNPKTKKWETRTENVGSLKKPDLCKGKRPHDFVLVLPYYVHLKPGAPYLNADQIEAYYESRKRKHNDEDTENAFQETLGIIVRKHWREDSHFYICSHCGKHLSL